MEGKAEFRRAHRASASHTHAGVPRHDSLPRRPVLCVCPRMSSSCMHAHMCVCVCVYVWQCPWVSGLDVQSIDGSAGGHLAGHGLRFPG